MLQYYLRIWNVTATLGGTVLGRPSAEVPDERRLSNRTE